MKVLHAGCAAYLGCAPLSCIANAESDGPVFKLLVEEEGVYRARYEDLDLPGSGLDGADLASSRLGLTNRSDQVPIWVEDGGDGVFGPGDWIEFIGERLRGEVSHLNEHSRYNVYLLDLEAADPARMRAEQTELVPPGRQTDMATLRRTWRLEEDILRPPPARSGEPEELWYWAKLTHLDRQPFLCELDLADLEEDPGGTVDLRLDFRGWSRPRSKPDPGFADHRVDVSLNGRPIGSAEWSGSSSQLLELPGVPVERFVRGTNRLELTVPSRKLGPDGEQLIDVVMLNWIEVAYPRWPRLDGQQAHFEVAGPTTPPALRLIREAPGELILYGTGGSRSRVPAHPSPIEQRGDRTEMLLRVPPGETSFFAASAARLKSPDLVVRDHPSDLASPRNRADYIMIAHPRLIDAVRPLADYHRSCGLDVALVDIHDVYDEFNHGIEHPGAIRALLDHAFHEWQSPRPRFVLLVGDASWDGKNTVADHANYAARTYRPGETTRVGEDTSTPYASGDQLNHRNLIPTWNHTTYGGHPASDNWFVSVDGDDRIPDMAIGRLPVVDPSEVAQIVEKTIAYASMPKVGPWRRKILLITSDSPRSQNASDKVAHSAALEGLRVEKVYPDPEETSSERHTARLLDAFDDGQLIVHFFGHGGRYMWRTGPPDLKTSHDLFTFDHLDQLKPNGRLPIVLSLTCYSAPFDHPSADSIGEKLLRIDGRGAVAVFAASWPNSPSAGWGQVLVTALTRPGTTVGEAIVQTKRRIQSVDFLETYNLLGDPALPVAAPQAPMTLALRRNDEGGLLVEGSVHLTEFAGSLVIDLLDDRGDIIRSITREVGSPDFAMSVSLSDAERTAVRAIAGYAWNPSRHVDAFGGALVSESTLGLSSPVGTEATNGSGG